MRLSEWRKTAPNEEALSGRVLAMLQPVLVDLGADPDADCWVVWGEDPESRYSLLAPTDAGLINIAIRLQGVDGPRATAKLGRWSKLSVSELSVESSDGHRLVAVQVEALVIKGVDQEADRICEFVRTLIAGMDGRTSAAVPISGVQAVAGIGLVSGVATPAVKAAPKPSPRTAGSNAAARAKPAKPGAKGVGNPAGLALLPPAGTGPAGPQEGVSAAPDAPPASTPDKPNAASQEESPHPPPTPIAARAATAQHAEQPEAEPDRSAWIGPHPIGEPTKRDPAKPRPWQP
jgi:hypothetical protein